jgi:hypothetical protein
MNINLSHDETKLSPLDPLGQTRGFLFSLFGDCVKLLLGLVGLFALSRSVNHIRLDDSDSRSVKDSSAVGRLASEFYIDFPLLFFTPAGTHVLIFYGDFHRKNLQENQGKAIPGVTEKVSAQASTDN